MTVGKASAANDCQWNRCGERNHSNDAEVWDLGKQDESDSDKPHHGRDCH